MAEPISLEEARRRLSRLGKTHADVAREVGVPLGVVNGLLYGRLQGKRGDAHKVAVALGLKEGVVVPPDATLAEAMRAAG
jgi:gp16 family phage-associated protein